MLKKLLLALAAVLAAAYAAVAIKVILNSKLERTHRVNSIAAATGFSTGAARFFLDSLDTLGIDLDSYSDSDLAEAMRVGFVFKFTEEK